MDNFKKIVERAFETEKFNQDFTILENGATKLLTETYTPDEANEKNFYTKPEIADDETTKLAIIFGEVLITPYIVDVGTETGTNDPESIKKTIRFITGDGQTEGIPVGPNGTPLENIYIDDGSNPQPVVDKDGRPSTKDVIIAASLGGAIQSIPAIWKKINEDSDAKVKEIDPVTGDKIKTKEEKLKDRELSQNTYLTQLADVTVDETSSETILVYDNCTKIWVAKTINEILQDNSTIEGAKGGKGGAGGVGGAGGDGGKGGDGGYGDTEVPPDEPELPNTDATQPTTDTPNKDVQFNSVELPDISENENNEYFEVFTAKGTNGIKLHFSGKNYKEHEFNPVQNQTDPESDYPCLKNENCPVNNPNSGYKYNDAGTFEIQICISVNVCGQDTIIQSYTFTETGYSETTYSFSSAWIIWCESDISNIINEYQGQMPDTVNVRIRRIDGGELGGTPKSNATLFFNGYSVQHGNQWYSCGGNYAKLPPPTDQYPNPPSPKTKKDDGLYPDTGPVGGSLGQPSCPTPEGIIIPAQPPTKGEAGQSGEPAGEAEEGTEGEAGEVIVADAPPVPEIELTFPTSRSYCKAHGATSFDPVPLPEAKTLTSGDEANNQIILSYEMVSGLATFDVVTPPVDVIVTGQGTTSMSFTGVDTAVLEATKLATINPDDNAAGTLQWKLVGVNSSDSCNGAIYKVVSCTTQVAESSPAASRIKLTGTEGSYEVYATPPSRQEQMITSAAIPFNTTLEQTAIDIANDINTNVQGKNALPVDNPTWLPLYEATAIGDVVRIAAPAAAGADFNGLSTRLEGVSGDASFDPFGSVLEMVGGVTKNITDFFDNSPFGEINDLLLRVGGNVLGAVATNLLFNRSSTVDVSIPYEDDVSVAFIYRGLNEIEVPTEYNQETRTGTPDYDSWNKQTKEIYTDNPAWCLYHYIINPKYGLGKDIPLTDAQKENLERDIFEIAKYCDEKVDGEPRFSLNTVITEGTKIEILAQLCSCFFGSYSFEKGGLRIHADMPNEKISMLVNQTNGNDFVYKHTTLKSFTNKVEVTFLDKTSLYNQSIAVVEEALDIEKLGEKKVEIFGYGITNKAQATRYARWFLETEQENSLVVNYVGGWDHYRLQAGDIVLFEESSERGERLAGRVAEVSGTTLTFDGDTVATIGDTILLTQEDGSIFETFIIEVLSPTQVIILQQPNKTVLPYSTFIIADQILGKRLYKVLSIDETEDGKFNTSIQLFKNNKFEKIG